MFPTLCLVVQLEIPTYHNIVFTVRAMEFLQSLLEIILGTSSWLVHYIQQLCVATQSRKIAYIPFTPCPVHELTGAKMAVTTKLNDSVWPALMKVLDDPAENARHIQGLVASSRTEHGKYQLLAHSVKDKQWHIAILIVIGVEQCQLLGAVSIGVRIIGIKYHMAGRFGEGLDILLYEQLPDSIQCLAVDIVLQTCHRCLGAEALV